MSEVGMAWDALQSLLIVGFVIGMVCAVVFAAIRVGWQMAPYLFIGAFLVWFFNTIL